MAKQEYLWQSFNLPDEQAAQLDFHESEALKSMDVQLDALRVRQTVVPNGAGGELIQTPKGRAVFRFRQPSPEEQVVNYTYGAFYLTQ